MKKSDKSAEKAIVHVNDLEEVESSDSTETGDTDNNELKLQCPTYVACVS